MKQFTDFTTVLKDWASLPVPGRLYVEGLKGSDVQNSVFWAVSSKEAKDGDYFDETYGTIPEVLKDKGAKSFLDTATFQDIVSLKLDNNPDLKVETDGAVFLHALEHYLEFDDFED